LSFVVACSALLSGVNALNFTIKTWVRILLVASYDLLLVMRVIMSFAHVMFFGVDAYGVSLPLYAVGTNWSALVIGLIAATALALAIRLFSPRVQSIFFAVWQRRPSLSPFNVFASQLSTVTVARTAAHSRLPRRLQARPISSSTKHSS
jgi:branched-chain amino acid transport system permease protein